MKKLLVLMLCCFAGLFFVSCGGSENSDSQKCEKNLDCPIGKVCSSGGVCVSPEESEVHDGENNDGNNGELPDDESGSDGGNSGTSDGEPADDSDYDDLIDPETGNCKPGKTRQCEYQGPEGSEGVGPCKAAISTCKEDGSWGKCEGEVLPVYESGEELCTDGIDNDCDGEVDNGTSCAYWQDTDLIPDADADADADPGIIDVGYTGNYSDAYQLPSDVENVCSDTCVPLKAECYPADINEGEVGLCNGLDDDCDGKVDEGCPCSAGQTQPCFAGPPNFRNVGTCQDGVQTCKVSMRGTKSVGVWGDCVGGISPKQDACDNADNNCNGCVDDKLCCAPPIDCSFDIGDAQPFADKTIDGTQIYDTGHKFNDADTATWEWSLTQGPCDIIINKVNSYMKGAKTQGELGSLADSDRKILLSGVGLSQLKLRFRLSGQYTLHLKVTRENGEVHECEWIIRVVAKGLRIELCWDTTGDVDVDLHMGKNNTTLSWSTLYDSTSACFYNNCKATSSNHPDWGYPNTENYDKEGNLKDMKNPRLDMDNISTEGEPENINVDNPNNNDTFRVGVKYFSGSKLTHPVINVYCGGTLKATYGVEPQVSGFTKSPYFWKVVEVKWVGDYASDACELTPQWNDSTGYVVNTSVPAYTSW